MDPLSITASVITVLGTADLAAKTLKKIIHLRDVPEVVLAINNEVSELRLTLKELETVLCARGNDVSTQEYVENAVWPCITAARTKLLVLENLIKGRLIRADGSLDKIAWLRVEDKVNKLQADLRQIRLNFGTMLGIISSKSTSMLETRFESLQFVTEKNHHMTEILVNNTENLQYVLQQMLVTQTETHTRLGSIEKLLTHDERSEAEKIHAPPLGAPGYSADPVYLQHNSLSALRMRFLQRRKCSPYCDCACHITTRFNSPRALQFLTGVLFIGYNNVPKLTRPCTNNSECEKSPEGFVAVNYYFPRWAVSRVLAACIRFTDYKGPELSIRIPLVRDPNDQLFTAASTNDVSTVKSLLDAKLASVIDVQHGTGHSALHIATMMSKTDVISLLLQYGAEPFMENATQETAYDMAWNTVLCFEDTPRATQWCVAGVKALFPSSSALEERRVFSRIHQIVCRLSPLDLETELERSSDRIDELDTDGRTALHWAAGRGDEKSVELLLRYGADPNIPDRIGQAPLRSSLKAVRPECMKLLMDYGANLMQIDNWDQTCLQAAMYYTDPVAFGTPLIMAGVDVNARDFKGNTALLEAVRMGHTDAVDLLVDNGADVNIQDQGGTSALMEAIGRNKTVMATKLLQSRIIDTSALDGKKQSILHYAAANAETPMLRVLCKFNIEGIDVNSKREDGLSAIEMAEQRQKRSLELDNKHQVDEVWIKAFADLLEHIVKVAHGPPPPYKDEEDTHTEYSFTNSPGSSVYFDAKAQLPIQIRTKTAPSLIASSTYSIIDSNPGTRPGTPVLRNLPILV